MTAVKQNLLTMVPDMPTLIPYLTEERANVVYDIFLSVKPETQPTDRKQRRLAAIQSGQFTRPSGRTAEEIDAEVRELRDERV